MAKNRFVGPPKPRIPRMYRILKQGKGEEPYRWERPVGCGNCGRPLRDTAINVPGEGLVHQRNCSGFFRKFLNR